jgi:hypothetical protein
MCLSYQNWASRRDPQGRGSHAAHLRPAQAILTFPSAVPFSTGRCMSPRRRRVSATVCIFLHCQLGQHVERRRAERGMPADSADRSAPVWAERIGQAVIRPIALLPGLVNHSAPSGPAVIPSGSSMPGCR